MSVHCKASAPLYVGLWLQTRGSVLWDRTRTRDKEESYGRSCYIRGYLTRAHLLHNRSFSYQQWDGTNWIDRGTIALFENTAFLDNEKLYNVYYHPPTSSVNYSFGKGANHRSGRLFFTDDHLAFTGTIHTAAGHMVAVRGNVRETVFNTQRKAKTDSTYTNWDTFTLGTQWISENGSQRLVSIFKLGTQDVSNRTAVTNVSGRQTTIEMMPDSSPFGSQDQFTIVVDYSGHTFTGSYTDASGKVYDWQGTAQEASIHRNIAHAAKFAAIDGKPLARLVPPGGFTAEERAATDTGPDLTVQDLMNVTSVMEVQVQGQTKILDTAQVQTGKYFQNILIDSLDQQWITDFFGGTKPLPPDVQRIMDTHQQFYRDKAVMNLGQMIHDNFGTDPSHRAAVAKIDNNKLDKAWKALGTDKDYATQSTDLYIQGYKDGVPGIQPYLKDDPKKWAQELYDTLTSDDFLNVWAVQVASAQFKNIHQQMYEWYVQLSVLDPTSTHPVDMLHTAFAVVIGSNFNKLRWSQDDIQPYLAKAIQDMLDNNPTFADEMLQSNAEQVKQLVQGMVSTFDTVEELTTQISNAMTAWANKPGNAEQAAIRGAGAAYGTIEEAVNTLGPIAQSKWAKAWAGFKELGPKVFGSLLYAAGAGFLIYQIATGEGLNPIQDISLAFLATGFMVKSVEKLLATGIGRWLQTNIQEGVSKIQDFASSLNKWFTEEGVEAEGWAVRVFGKSSAEFFAKRLGPALAVLGIVISAMDLVKAIKSGDVRDIIFESINTFFALALAVTLGFELMSFAWAGPVGVAIAVVGAIVALVQLIWNLVSPPSPPPDPVERFVDGPLSAAGFTTA